MLNPEDRLVALEAEVRTRMLRDDEYANTLAAYKVAIRDLSDDELEEELEFMR